MAAFVGISQSLGCFVSRKLQCEGSGHGTDNRLLPRSTNKFGCQMSRRCRWQTGGKLNEEGKGTEGRTRLVALAEAALSDTRSKVEVHPSKEVAVGDKLEITYTPPKSWSLSHTSDKSNFLMLAVGFNGWDGEKKPLMFPLSATGDSSYRATVTVPNFAKSLELGFTDGTVRWDINNGKYYRVFVKYQQELNKKGEVETVVAEESDNEPEKNVKGDEKFEQILTSDEEASLHRIRGEAALIGEREGLGNVQISYARDAFDRFDYEGNGTIKLSDLKEVLRNIDFDLEEERFNELVRKYVAEKPNNDTKVSMTAYMLLYSDLERNDEGIEMMTNILSVISRLVLGEYYTKPRFRKGEHVRKLIGFAHSVSC